MFGILDKIKNLGRQETTKEIAIMAPIDGEIVGIEEVPDVVFSEKVVGDGIAIIPTGSKLVAPINGVIGKIFDTNHAFSIESKDGIELFIHVGIDTVDLKGEGFHRVAQEGQKVKVGDTILEIDLPLLTAKSKSILSPIVISNMDELKSIEKCEGIVKAGEDVVLVVIK